MREVDVKEITKNIKEMCIEANHYLSKDMKRVFNEAADAEESPLGRQILDQLKENLDIAGTDIEDVTDIFFLDIIGFRQLGVRVE